MFDFDTSIIDTTKYKSVLKNNLSQLTFTNGDKEEIVRKKIELLVQSILLDSTIFKGNMMGLSDMFKSEKKVIIDNRQIGFIDSDFKNVIIEYKRYERLDKKADLIEAQNQLKDYMFSDDLLKYNLLWGFLTDGKSIYIYKKESDIFETINIFSNCFNENTLDFFIRCLVNYDKKEITPFSLKDEFAILTNTTTNNSSTKKLFLELLTLKKKSTNARTTLLFTEWEKLFKLSESDATENEEVRKRRNALSDLVGYDVNNTIEEYNIIFALHTVYSLLIKLIALKAAKENTTYHIDFFEYSKKSNSDILKFLQDIETGSIYKKMNISNMIEGDFFSWYIKENLTTKFYENFKTICKDLSKYESFSIKRLYKTQDFFRELYQSCIPDEIRHSFGEYYTPYWLADGVISDYISRNKINDIYKSLDPTCGSGTFIMVNMDKLIHILNSNYDNLSNKEKVEILLSNCYGIDLNPLAVLSAKINYFMNIASIYDGSYDIELPIYLGDSSYMPSYIVLDGVKCITYDFFTDVDKNNNFIHFCLPLNFIKSKHFITDMDYVETIITSKIDAKNKKKNALEYLSSVIEDIDKNEKVIFEISSLLDILIDLEDRNLNSIWLRIFANYLKASSITDVSLISGNPPWVDWKNLPDKYCEKLKISCKNTGIFSNDKNVGGISLNICALIAMKCSEKYLSNDGELSFLMPTSILYNKSFEGFRNFTIYNQKYYFCKIVNWYKAGKPFDPVNIDFSCFTITKKKQDYKKGIPYEEYKLKPKYKLNDTHAHFDTESLKLEKSLKTALMLDRPSNNPFAILNKTINIDKLVGVQQYAFRKGLGLKAEVHKLVYAKEHETNKNLAYFYTFEKKGKYKYQSKTMVVLEKEYVRPLIETPYLSPFENTWDNLYTVFPYEWGNKLPIPFKDLQKKAPYLAKYLLNNKTILDNQSDYNKRIQSTNEFYGIIRTADYMFRDFFACIKDNGQLLCANVSKVTTHWGKSVTPVFDGHVSYISERVINKKATPITEDEMYFIVGIMNCPDVKEYVESSSSEQSIGTKFDLNLPFYDTTNEKHQLISKTTKEIIELVQKKNLLVSGLSHDKINDKLLKNETMYISNKQEFSTDIIIKLDNYFTICKEINNKLLFIQKTYFTL